MDSTYGDDLGVVDTRIADGEISREGLGKAKKVAVGAGTLVAGAGAFCGGCKLVGNTVSSVGDKWKAIDAKIDTYNNVYNETLTRYADDAFAAQHGITAAEGTTIQDAIKGSIGTEGGVTQEQWDAAREAFKPSNTQIQGATAAAKANIGEDLPKRSIFQKAANVFSQQGVFGEGILGKGNIVGSKLSTHWSNLSSKLNLRSATRQALQNDATLEGDALKAAAQDIVGSADFKQGFASNILTKMSNYPMLAAAGLAGAGFFIYKGIKKLVNKRKGEEEPSFAR